MNNNHVILKNIISNNLKGMIFIDKQQKEFVYAILKLILVSNREFKRRVITIDYYKLIKDRITKMVLVLYSKKYNTNKLLSLVDIIYRS